jgi:hypothetical protein
MRQKKNSRIGMGWRSGGWTAAREESAPPAGRQGPEKGALNSSSLLLLLILTQSNGFEFKINKLQSVATDCSKFRPQISYVDLFEDSWLRQNDS